MRTLDALHQRISATMSTDPDDADLLALTLRATAWVIEALAPSACVTDALTAELATAADPLRHAGVQDLTDRDQSGHAALTGWIAAAGDLQDAGRDGDAARTRWCMARMLTTTAAVLDLGAHAQIAPLPDYTTVGPARASRGGMTDETAARGAQPAVDPLDVLLNPTATPAVAITSAGRVRGISTRQALDAETVLVRLYSHLAGNDQRRPAQIALATSGASTAELPHITIGHLPGDGDRMTLPGSGTRRLPPRTITFDSWASQQVRLRAVELRRLGIDAPTTPLLHTPGIGSRRGAAQANLAIQITSVITAAGLDTDRRLQAESLRRGAARRLGEAGRALDAARLLGYRNIRRALEVLDLETEHYGGHHARNAG